ncbi:MAG: hypothetical protein J5I90_00145 [Caldilineales bacterium]|nr:hypothetical protein [Caldilineales bacterium]
MTSLTPRQSIHHLLTGRSLNRLACGELVWEPDLARAALGLASDAAVPLDAERAMLQRWGHDLITVSFSGGWGAPQQPDEEDALFRLGYWQQNSALFVAALIDGPFSAVAKALGWEQTLVQLTKGTEEAVTLMADAVIEFGEQVQALADAGADGIIIGDDIAYRRGPYVKPEHLRRSYFPYLTLYVLAAQDAGLPVIFHSDGNLWPVWEDLVQSGIDGVQGLDAFSAMSLALARQRSHPELCLWGNLDLSWLAQPHSAEETSRQLHEMLDPVAGTPVIFGLSGGLAPGIPLAYLDVLYQAVRDFSWPKRIESHLAEF